MNQRQRVFSVAAVVLLGVAAAAIVWSGARRVGGHEAKVARAQLNARTMLVYDQPSGTTTRGIFSVWDPHPERGLEFEWRPDRPSAATPGPIEGSGELTWRRSGSSADDASAVTSVYRGEMRRGRPHGMGDLRTRDGIHYDGAWRDGVYDGKGRLQLPDGSSYEGEFQAGRFHGRGVLFDVRHGTYAGEFVDGQKHGEGTTRPIGDVAYQSVWNRGAEIGNTRRIRLAQSTTSSSPLARSELQIAALIDFFRDDLLEDNRTRAGYHLPYAIKNEGAGLAVYPDDKQLMLQWKGGGLTTCQRRYRHMQVRPVPLTFKLANRSSANIKVVAAMLEVAWSDPDLQPFVVEDCTAARVLDGFNPFLRFRNFGWGNPLRTSATLRFVPRNGTGPSIVTTMTIGDLTQGEIDLDLTKSLAMLGVTVDQLKRWSDAIAAERWGGVPCPAADSDQECLLRLKRSGTLGQLSRVAHIVDGILLVRLEGELSFDWIDAKGARHAYIAPFERDVRLGSRIGFGDSEGAGPSDRDPQGIILVELNLGRANYSIDLPYAGVISPAQAGDLRLAIKTRKSAQGRFRLKLRAEDGRVFESKQVDLQTFIAKIY